MRLRLEEVSQVVSGHTHIYPLDLELSPNQINVLLGATQAGKTTLMRMMAGLDRPAAGRVLAEGKDVTGVPVRQRNIAMVYQQFINYPSLTVFDNIASPLKLRGDKEVTRRVNELAERLHIEMFLDRLPAELSGGQQQRVALARALAKNAPLVLLDEPLVNLDYKLREELREELGQLFASGESTVVYSTTEPGEALLLGGYTAVLDEGELLQYGPTAEVFHRPNSVRVARAFNDPPMNLIDAELISQASGESNGLSLPGGAVWPIETTPDTPQKLVIGVRASAMRLHEQLGDVTIRGKVELAEISGSDTFVHIQSSLGELVAQVIGVHQIELGTQIDLHLSMNDIFLFDAKGPLVAAPRRNERSY
jgi:glycerol transport system ATP-binding protein